ncbi:hypothetical protein EVAR_45973_1 [Eumeta japonica]|uniref:Uncharacterized protein n=1 Tax=Eumeta variegata TaxID=151549 RepID=A0A4C1YRU1_EUMVA|nr:hypothetical protein EVAR_45973_1 [Eumeta japonica]
MGNIYRRRVNRIVGVATGRHAILGGTPPGNAPGAAGGAAGAPFSPPHAPAFRPPEHAPHTPGSPNDFGGGVKSKSQDVASKSLSGLESLVDQIPSIAEGPANGGGGPAGPPEGGGVGVGAGAAPSAPPPLPEAYAPALYGPYGYGAGAYGNNSYGSPFVGYGAGGWGGQLMRPTPGYLGEPAAWQYAQYGAAAGSYAPANYAPYYNGYAGAAPHQQYLSHASHVLDHLAHHKDAPAHAPGVPAVPSVPSVGFGGFLACKRMRRTSAPVAVGGGARLRRLRPLCTYRLFYATGGRAPPHPPRPAIGVQIEIKIRFGMMCVEKVLPMSNVRGAGAGREAPPAFIYCRFGANRRGETKSTGYSKSPRRRIYLGAGAAAAAARPRRSRLTLSIAITLVDLEGGAARAPPPPPPPAVAPAPLRPFVRISTRVWTECCEIGSVPSGEPEPARAAAGPAGALVRRRLPSRVICRTATEYGSSETAGAARGRSHLSLIWVEVLGATGVEGGGGAGAAPRTSSHATND